MKFIKNSSIIQRTMPRLTALMGVVELERVKKKD